VSNLEIDLWNNADNVVVSIAQADPNVWAAIATQCTALATQQGFGITTGPLYNSPERLIDSVGAFQNWMATQSNVGTVQKSQPAGTSWPLVAFTGAALLLVVGGFWAALKLAGRPRF
jgi:hypothetical protein